MLFTDNGRFDENIKKILLYERRTGVILKGRKIFRGGYQAWVK